MAHNLNRRAVLTEIVIASGLTAIGFVTGQGPLMSLVTTAAGVGGNWVASLAERGFQHWRNSWFTERGALNQDIAWALSQALQDALRQLEREWRDHRHYRYLVQTTQYEAKRTLQLLDWLRQDARTLFQRPNEFNVVEPKHVSALLRQDRSVGQRILARTLTNALHGYDEEFAAFVSERLPDEWSARFFEVLKDPGDRPRRAWRACQQLWQASLASALDEMGQNIAETKDAVLWLQDWAHRLEVRPVTERDPTGWDALEASLLDIKSRLDGIKEDTVEIKEDAKEIKRDVKTILEQRFVPSDALHPSEKWKVYVSSTHTNLQPYREAASQYLAQLDYEVIPDQGSEQLPVEDQLELIDDCDLFLGIYPHEEGVLLTPPPGESSPLPIQELERARQSFHRCLIFVASRDLSDLRLEAPREPIPGEPPKPRELSVPRPPASSKGLQRWLQSIWAQMKGLPTPDQRDKAELKRYIQRRQEIGRLQEELERQYREAKARYETEVRQAQEIHDQRLEEHRKRIELNQQFLAKIKTSFPVRRFQSQDDLISLIRQDLDALARGEIFGFSEDPLILQRWGEWVGYHRQVILDGLPFRPPPKFTSPVESLVDALLEYAWHKRAEEFASGVVRLAEETVARGLADVVKDKLAPYCRLPIDCQDESYSGITYSLRDWCEQASTAIGEVRRWISENQETFTPGYVPVLTQTLERWETTIDDLYRFLDEEAYGKCLLVMGRSGSGKTHLVAHLLQDHAQHNEHYYLYVTPKSVTRENGKLPSLEQVLMEAACFDYSGQPKGPKWRSFEELAHFVSRGQSQDEGDGVLIIIFDDLDLWIRDQGLDPEALKRFIASHTNLHNVYWVICLSEANYDLVADPGHERFWRQYGFVGQEAMPPPEGWVSLDHMNKKSQQWKKIVGHQLEASGKDLSPELTAALDRRSRELLHNPFIAWVFGKLLDEGELPQDLLNLNYINFVKEFWDRRLEQLASEAIRRPEVRSWQSKYWRAIKLTAGSVMENQSLMIKRRPLLEYLVDADRGDLEGFAQVAEEVVDNLARMDLLLSVYDPEAIGTYGDHYRLGFLPLWQWQSGKYLIQRLPKDLAKKDLVEAWFKRYFAGDWGQDYLAGVLEFAILLADSGDSVVPQSPALTLTQIALRLQPAYRADIWLAASKASPEYQHQLAIWLERYPPGPPLRGRELHRYLYFLKNAEPGNPSPRGLTPTFRMKLLRPHYSGLQTWGYFKSFLESLVANAEDGDRVAEAFAYLYGIEDHLEPDLRWFGTRGSGLEGLSRWTYNSLWRLAEPVEPEQREDKVHQWVLQFLAEVSKLVPPSSRDREYDKHWILMTRYHCERLVENLAPAKLNWLEANGWFRWSPRMHTLSDSVLFTMEEQFTTAGGQWYREKAASRQKYNYVEAVRAWANGSSGQKGVALFLIYHTVPSKGPYSNRPVDSRLWEIFKGLHNDSSQDAQRLMRIGKIQDWYERQQRLSQRRR